MRKESNSLVAWYRYDSAFGISCATPYSLRVWGLFIYAWAFQSLSIGKRFDSTLFFLSNHETVNARSRSRHNSLKGCRDMERIHIGKAIRAELQRQERGVSWLARHLACDRSNVYRIFRKKSLDTELLSRICTILQHDFFADLSSSIDELSPNPP